MSGCYCDGVTYSGTQTIMTEAILLGIAVLGVSTSLFLNFAPNRLIRQQNRTPPALAAQGALDELLGKLEHFSEQVEASKPEREYRMLNITRDTGEFLSAMIAATGAQKILEIGTSNGYSTLWLAHALSLRGGTVTTIEHSSYKTALAAENFRLAGLEKHIRQIQGDAGQALNQLGPQRFDLIFLDADRAAYKGLWPNIRAMLSLRGVLIIDNAVSHAHELVDFFAVLQADSDFTTSLVPVGNGEMMAVRVAVRPSA